ncbi:MAG: hypothetical protein KAS15_08630, partial [Nanoarchaeota archaeon]|nr:hypothetical protein [Nanoarchaeota archaeon]
YMVPKMNILIAYPKFSYSFRDFQQYKKCFGKHTFTSLSLLKIASMLPNDWGKKLVDANITKLDDAHIEWADIVFISAIDLQKDSAREILSRCKASGKTVVGIGKAFATHNPRFQEADHFILDKTELTLPLFIQDLMAGNTKRFYTSAEKHDKTQTPAQHMPFNNLDYVFSGSPFESSSRLSLWFKNNIHKNYFHRNDLRKDLRNFIDNELPRLYKKYQNVDAITLLSGGADSLLAALKFADENQSKRILLVTFCHHFHESNPDDFIRYFHNLDAIKTRTNIIGHEVINIRDIFNSLNKPFKERYSKEKLLPCIACKILMAYLADTILFYFKIKESREQQKYILTGNRGPPDNTFFQQQEKYETYLKKCISCAKYFSPVYYFFDKDDVFKELKKKGVEKYLRDKEIMCIAPFFLFNMGFQLQIDDEYAEKANALIEDILQELKKCDGLKTSLVLGCQAIDY